MEFSKHKNHRNRAYLNWLRLQKCVVSGQKAECAHHIRLGTNGGTALKPSDYFCIPLLNEYHTTGLFALHVIGEDTFLNHFELKRNDLFASYLERYLLEKYEIKMEKTPVDLHERIARMIETIEQRASKGERSPSKAKPKKSDTEDEYYQKAKEEKRTRDKELRSKLKEENKMIPKVATSLKDNEFYQKAKELKRIKDKELRQKMSAANPNRKLKASSSEKEFYEKAKEQKRQMDKELRAKLKLSKKTKKTSVTQTEFYQKAKELKRAKDKELRQKLKEERKNT